MTPRLFAPLVAVLLCGCSIFDQPKPDIFVTSVVPDRPKAPSECKRKPVAWDEWKKDHDIKRSEIMRRDDDNHDKYDDVVANFKVCAAAFVAAEKK